MNNITADQTLASVFLPGFSRSSTEQQVRYLSPDGSLELTIEPDSESSYSVNITALDNTAQTPAAFRQAKQFAALLS